LNFNGLILVLYSLTGITQFHAVNLRSDSANSSPRHLTGRQYRILNIWVATGLIKMRVFRPIKFADS